MGTFFAKAAFDTAYALERMGSDGNLSEADLTLRTLELQLQTLRHKLDELIQS